MTSLGNLTVFLKADIKGLTQGLQAASKEVSKAAVNMQKKGAGGFSSLNPALKQAESQLKDFEDAGVNASVNVTKGLKGYQVGMARTSVQTKQTFGMMMKNMLSFQSFFGKIIHYITFSIGVQMVMMVRKAFVDMIKGFADFERAAVNAASVSGYLGASMKSVQKHLMGVSKALSKHTLFSAQQVIDAFYDLASAGYDVSQMGEQDLMPFINYATATQSDLKQSIQAVTVTLKAFSLELADATQVVDIFTSAITTSFLTMEKLREGMKYVAPIAGTLGVSVAETTAALAVLADRGLAGGQAGQRLAMILTKLIKPTDKAQNTLQAMGYEMEEITPLGNNLMDVLFRLQESSFNAGTAVDMFRARTAGAAAVLVANAEAVAYLSQRYEMAEGITSSLASAQQNTLYGAMELMKHEFQTLGMDIAEELLPTIKKVISFVKDSVVPALRSFADIVGRLYKIFKPLINILLKLSPFIILLYIGYKLLNVILASSIVKFIAVALAKTMDTAASLKLTLSNWALFKSELAAAFGASVLGKGLIMLSKIIMANPILLLIGAIVIAAVALWSMLQPINELNSEQKYFASTLKGVTGYVYQLTAGVEDMDEAFDNLWDGIKQGAPAGILGSAMLGMEALLDPDKFAGRSATMEEIAKEGGGSVAEQWGRGFVENFTFGLVDMSTEEMRKAGKEVIFNTQQMTESSILFVKVAGDMNVAGAQLKDTFDRYEVSLYALTRDQAKFAILTRAQAMGTTDLASATSSLADEAMALGDTQQVKIYQDIYRALIQADGITNVYGEDLDELIEKFGPLVAWDEMFERANMDVVASEKSLISATGGVIRDVRTLTESLDFYVGKLEKWAEATFKIKSKHDDLERAERDVIEATEDLTDAMLEYGAGTSEAVDAEEDLMSAIRNRIDITEDISELEVESSEAWNLVNNALKEGEVTLHDVSRATTVLGKEEKDLLELTRDVIVAREQLIAAKAEDALWDARLAHLQKVRAEGYKYLEDRVAKLYEVQDKLFEIEYKLYKLRHDEDDQLDEMFQTLAEQGLISDEMIDKYVEMEKAEGAVLSLNHSYIQALSDLTEEEENLVKAYMKGEATEQELRNAGIANVDTFISMKDAQDDLKKATSELDAEMTPLVGDLTETGIVSSETAKQYYDLIDNAYELAAAEAKLGDKQEEVAENFEVVLSVVSQMATALMDEGESMQDIFGELTDTLGVGAMSVAEINALTGKSAEGMSDFSDEDLILAATLKMVGTQLGMYEEGMLGGDLAMQAFLVSSENTDDAQDELATSIQRVYKNLYDAEDGLITYALAMKKAEDTTNDVASATQTLMDKVDLLGTKVGINASDFLIGGEYIGDLDDATMNVSNLYITIGNAELLDKDELGEDLENIDYDELAKDAGKSAPDFWAALWQILKAISPIFMFYDILFNLLSFIDWGSLANDIATGFVNAITGVASWFMQAGRTLVDWFINGFLTIFTRIVIPIMQLPMILYSHMYTLTTKFFEWGRNLITGLINGIIGMISSLLSTITELINQIKGKFAGAITWLLSAGRNIITGLANGIRSVVSTITSTLHNVYLNIINKFTNAANWLYSAGWNLIQGLINGINAVKNRLFETLIGIRDRVVNIVKDIKKSAGDYLSGKQGIVPDFIPGIGGFARGGIAKGATLGVFGEAGAEALIPLEGANRKFGRNILETVLTEYYPEMLHQTGGIFGGGASSSVGGNGDTYTDNFNILGPVNVTGIGSVQDMSEEFKYRYRSSR